MESGGYRSGMTLQERISRWPRRKRMYGFVATMAGGFAIVVVVARVVEPEITAPLSFWRNVIAELVVVYAFAILVTPRGQRWRTNP